MRTFFRRAASLAVLCGAVAFVALPGASAAAAKPLYSIVIAPGTINGGATTTVTATIASPVGGQAIESVELFVPTPLQVLSASLPAGLTQPVVTTCANGASMVPCVQVLGLNIKSGQSVTVTMSVEAPPACANMTAAWGAAARSDNKLAQLSVGNLTLDPGKTSMKTLIADGCHLQFGIQPHNVMVGQPITGADYDTTGSPVTVQILDAGGVLVTSSSASVTTGLVSNPSGAVLGGSLTVPASGGIATFSTLTVDQPGLGYTLGASSAGMASATSSPFDAQNQAAQCTVNPCVVSTSTNQGSAQITATGAGGTSGTLTESVNVPSEPPLACAGYVTADPNTYDFLTTNPTLSKVVTITITDPLGSLQPANQVLVTQQICFEAPYAFTAKGGLPAAPTTLPDGSAGFIGLLPSCDDPNSGPCHNRSADSTVTDPNSPTGYDIVLVADLPAAPGDPRMN